ncbi:MAG: hypothetical protein Q4F41_10725 [Eubacteriales bacterium]|nr:hypothetical protein [Eubacteriales bacterium]
MNQRLWEVLHGKEENYILPFFWQHGASEETLREYMGKIAECGIRAVCVEARPHPDFAGPGWWRDLDVILEEAKRLGMKVWILDDSHFPTGFANGAVRSAPEHLKRWSLVERMLSEVGPVSGCKYEAASHLGRSFTDQAQYQFGEPFREELVAVLIGKRNETENGEVWYSNLADVTEKVDEKGWLYLDFPEGIWNIFVYTKRLGAAAGQNDYISFLERDSVKLLLDAVYEPHFQHYQSYFGSVLAGFFSDEPGFYNRADSLYGAGRIGDPMPLPWSADVEKRFAEKMGGGLTALPGLFHALDGTERKARCCYMDLITQKYQENFSDQIGEWCRAHGVAYIGHVLEDGILNRHLGPGIGHYFRAMHGQDMSGIDVVLNGLLPDRDYGDGSFYHYELPVLAASAAHQNPRMQGRAMCEIFGAYGWSEGVSLMKWMADHMLANGVNWFVPHAFSEKEFPDPDCPPHFYAHGKNPQFRYLGVLFSYMNRVCHLLNGGCAGVETAVFFPAEGEWAGKAETFGRLGKRFLQNQVPYETLCADGLKQARVEQGRICLGKAAYKNLFVDGIEFLPEEVLAVLEDCYRRGANIWYVGNAPRNLDGEIRMEIPVLGDEARPEIPALGDEARSEIPVLRDEAVLLLVEDSRTCKVSVPAKWLRCYRYELERLTVFFITNASIRERLEADVTLRMEDGRKPEALTGYDALNGELFVPEGNPDGSIHLSLERGESVLFLAGLDGEVPRGAEPALTVRAGKTHWRTFDGPFRISTADYTDLEQFTWLETTDALQDIARKKDGFAGIIRYEAGFEGRFSYLSLGRCYEAVQVWVNGQSAGVRIAEPYLYDIRRLTRDGENTLRIEVATTLTNAVPDGLSMERGVEPQGMFGPVKFSME